jgi:hypothetical protein
VKIKYGAMHKREITKVIAVSSNPGKAIASPILKVESTPVEGADGGPQKQSGPEGLEPTRYGDWERNGRCIDF